MGGHNRRAAILAVFFYDFQDPNFSPRVHLTRGFIGKQDFGIDGQGDG